MFYDVVVNSDPNLHLLLLFCCLHHVLPIVINNMICVNEKIVLQGIKNWLQAATV
jgi:hypothetical protein